MLTTLKQKLLDLPVLGNIIRVVYPRLKSLLLKRRNRINVLEAKISQLEKTLNERQSQLKIDFAKALARKQDITSFSASTESLKNTVSVNNHDDFYAAFEQAFRADPGTLKQHLESFMPFINGLAQRQQRSLNMLDIGCGRGEWLALMREHQHQATGIDLNQQTIDACRMEGLRAVQGDALGYLAGIEAESLDVITAFHVVEHLSFEEVLTLFDACLRVLKPGGLVIFETPNPENLTVGAYSFYFDPTHRNPIPPLTLRFIAEQRGFKHCEIHRFNPRQEVDSSALSQQWFEGPVDYALIGFK